MLSWNPFKTTVYLHGLIVWVLLSGLQAQEQALPLIETEIAPPPPPTERLEKRGSWEWHVLRMDGREYVRFEDIHRFYRFETIDVVGDEVILESLKIGMSLRFLVGMRQAQFKGYKTFLSFPPVRFKDHLYLSRVDLALLVDPTIRPAYVGLKKDTKEAPKILIKASADDKLAAAVAQHLKPGLKAFGMTAVTEVPKPAEGEESSDPIFAKIELSEHPGNEDLWTLALAPYGTPKHGEDAIPEDEAKVPGNAQDKVNVALGMALHATLMETVEGILDGGLRRDRSAFLSEAIVPAISISLPTDSKASAEVLGAAIVRGIRRFRNATDRSR